jgi:hypothetical protein
VRLLSPSREDIQSGCPDSAVLGRAISHLVSPSLGTDYLGRQQQRSVQGLLRDLAAAPPVHRGSGGHHHLRRNETPTFRWGPSWWGCCPSREKISRVALRILPFGQSDKPFGSLKLRCRWPWPATAESSPSSAKWSRSWTTGTLRKWRSPSPPSERDPYIPLKTELVRLLSLSGEDIQSGSTDTAVLGRAISHLVPPSLCADDLGRQQQRAVQGLLSDLAAGPPVHHGSGGHHHLRRNENSTSRWGTSWWSCCPPEGSIASAICWLSVRP